MDYLNKVRITGKLLAKKLIGHKPKDGLIVEVSSNTSTPFNIHAFEDLADDLYSEISINSIVDLNCKFVYLDSEKTIIGLQIIEYFQVEPSSEFMPF